MPPNDGKLISETDLVGQTDAQIWAKTWLQIISENPSIPTDEGTMIGWFANAIMAGYQFGYNKGVEVGRKNAPN